MLFTAYSVLKNEDAIPYAEEGLVAVADGLGGAGSTVHLIDRERHTQFERELYRTALCGFAPDFSGGVTEVLDTVLKAVEECGFVPGKDITLALDCAASEFYKDGVYDYRIFEGEKGKVLSSSEQIDYLKELISRYPIDSIEDGMSEYDWTGWSSLTAAIGERCQLVGDDLFTTNTRLLKRGIAEKAGNAILIKPNQIGTLTETLDAIELAHRNNFAAVISHRSGETEDCSIADIAVAVNAGQIKTGSLSRSERICKYNQLLRIEEQLGMLALYGKI